MMEKGIIMPALPSPWKGEGTSGELDKVAREPQLRLLPLSGGGWVGVRTR